MEPDDGLLHICTSTPSVNPDGSVQVFRPEWRTETVVGLANGIADDRAFERMPILADALEEAGCDDLAILDHCRAAVHHSGDCWVLEVISGAGLAAAVAEAVTPLPVRPNRPKSSVARRFGREVANDSLLQLMLSLLGCILLGGAVAMFTTTALPLFLWLLFCLIGGVVAICAAIAR